MMNMNFRYGFLTFPLLLQMLGLSSAQFAGSIASMHVLCNCLFFFQLSDFNSYKHKSSKPGLEIQWKKHLLLVAALTN